MERYKEEIILSGQSMAASFESDQINILYFKNYSLQYTFSGSPADTVKIQVSNDEMGVTSASSSWDDLDGSSYAISAAGTLTQNANEQNYGKIKVVYTRTSGTGSMTVKLVAKS